MKLIKLLSSAAALSSNNPHYSPVYRVMHQIDGGFSYEAHTGHANIPKLM